MIITVHLKDPDAFSDAIAEAVKKSRPAGLSDDEWEGVRELRSDISLRPWVEYGEYVSIRFDTEEGTAVVLKSDES